MSLAVHCNLTEAGSLDRNIKLFVSNPCTQECSMAKRSDGRWLACSGGTACRAVHCKYGDLLKSCFSLLVNFLYLVLSNQVLMMSLTLAKFCTGKATTMMLYLSLGPYAPWDAKTDSKRFIQVVRSEDMTSGSLTFLALGVLIGMLKCREGSLYWSFSDITKHCKYKMKH